MLERRRYEIGDVSLTRSDILQRKLKKHVKWISLLGFCGWFTLSLVVIPPSRVIRTSLSSTQSIPSATTSHARERHSSFYENLKSWLRKSDQRLTIKYHKSSEILSKGNTVLLNKNESDLSNNTGHEEPDAKDNKEIVFVPGSNPKIRIHKTDFLDDKKANEIDATESKLVKWSAEKSLGLHLNQYLTQPTVTCKRLVRVGGRSCINAYDGSKLVCMDDDVKPNPLNCLVYSFGVGNDFTFDNHIQDYGCEVHSFDHDDDHEIYDYRQGPLAYFHKARIGVQQGYFKTCEQTQYGVDCQPSIHYQTISDIQKMLGHEARKLDYFKMDIEGAEWLVLADVIHNSTILTNTKQIALEVHFDNLKHVKTIKEKQGVLKKYLKVFLSLQNLGFKLAAYEENELKPQYAASDDATVSIYAEVLLLKRTDQRYLHKNQLGK